MKYDQLAIFVGIFLLVTVVGFLAARWRRGDLKLLDEWGLAGRRFGTLVTWFLLGGDLYTAYTFVAVPALVFGTGALGLFAIPYTIIVYPLVFLVMPKFWAVCRQAGHVTPADYVKARFDSRFLALLVAITGIVATMPYIALQIFGIQVVLAEMGLPIEVALVIAFVVLALFTYLSGLRAPALIAVVKDVMIWAAVLIAVIWIPIKLGGFGAIFAHVPVAKQNLAPAQFAGFSTLALGSALALFLYPHAITGVLSAKSARVVARNAAFLPAYSFMLGLIALLGYMAIAAGIQPVKPYGANIIVPALLDKELPSAVAGFAFAAIAIGALVPASVMSIAAANLFNRNIWREYIRRRETPTEEANVSKVVSLLVKVGAVAFIIFAPTQYAITLQLAGGVWIVQTLPAVFLGLYLGWLSRWPAIAGWAVGTALGTWMLLAEKFQSSLYPFAVGGIKTTLYIGLVSLAANLLVVLVGSAIGYALRARRPAAEYQRPALG